MSVKERAMKRAAQHVGEGERVVFACVCQQKGTANTNALGGLLGHAVMAGSRKRRQNEAAEAGFPLAASMLVTVTDRRVLVTAGKKVLGTVEPSALAGADVVKKNAISPWTIQVRMANGAQVPLEVARVGGPAELVEAISGLAAAASHA